MSRKQALASMELWRCAVRAFTSLVACTIHAFAIHVAAESNASVLIEAFWDTALDAIEGCLYQVPTSTPVVEEGETVSEDRLGDDQLQLQLVSLVRDLLAPPPLSDGSKGTARSTVPASKAPRCIAVLQKGATSSVTPTQNATATANRFAEEFASACFSALLDPKVSSTPTAQLEALDTLVDKCMSVLKGLCARSDPAFALEAPSVLRAINDMLTSNHQAKVLPLYPLLVDCTAVAEGPLRVTLASLLKSFTVFFR